jgi:hypothetical protein
MFIEQAILKQIALQRSAMFRLTTGESTTFRSAGAGRILWSLHSINIMSPRDDRGLEKPCQEEGKQEVAGSFHRGRTEKTEKGHLP